MIDTGAGANPELLANLAQHSDFLVIPTTPDALALNARLKTLDVLRGIDKYAVLLTVTPPRPSRDADEARAVLVDLGVQLFEVSIPRAVALQKAALAGVTVDEVRDPRAAGVWAAYEAVGREMVRRVNG